MTSCRWAEDDAIEWVNGGYAKSKRTGRWHAVLHLADGESLVSDASFRTTEEVLAYLKQWAESNGGSFDMVQ